MQSSSRLLLLLVGLWACAGPQPEDALREASGGSRPWSGTTLADRLPPVVLVPQGLDQALQNLGPEILLPTKNPDDRKMKEIGGVVIRKSHVYDRMLEEEPMRAKGFLDHLIFDALLAQEAKRHSITVDPKQIDAAADKEIKDLRQRVEKEWSNEMGFDEYCQQRLGMSSESFRSWRRLLLARDLYRNYVIRYLATLEDRVQVRIFAHSDRKVVEDVRNRAQQGADFKSLVLRKRSQHKPSNRNGGLMPAFGRDYPSRLTEHAFRLEPGDLSEVLEMEAASSKVYFVLFCVKQMAGRKRGFGAAREELDRELKRNPVSVDERQSMNFRLRSRSESLKKPPGRR